MKKIKDLTRKELEKELKELREYKEETLHRWVPEDVTGQAEQMGVELTDDELDMVCARLEFPTEAVWCAIETQISWAVDDRA